MGKARCDDGLHRGAAAVSSERERGAVLRRLNKNVSSSVRWQEESGPHDLLVQLSTYISEGLGWRIGIAVLLVTVTFLHYFTSTGLGYFHQLYQVLYFLPIILASMRFGLPGGLTAALAVTALYLPHVFLQWGGARLENLARFLMLVLYNVVGIVTGYLASRERAERERYQRTAEELSVAYARLKESTERLAEAESELLHMDRLAVLGELAATVAHEVRNPLGAIRGAAEILDDENVPDGTRRRFAQVILREVDRLNAVVENYLGIARRREVSLQSTDLKSVVETVSRLISTQARRKGIRVHIELPEEPAEIRTDVAALQQVLLNLVLNAIAASPQDGTVLIALRKHSTGYTLSVSDEGPGIPEETKDKIWEPFYTTRSDGTGLGLAIVRRIAKKMGWRVNVSSEPGRGTTFEVLIEG